LQKYGECDGGTETDFDCDFDFDFDEKQWEGEGFDAKRLLCWSREQNMI